MYIGAMKRTFQKSIANKRAYLLSLEYVKRTRIEIISPSPGTMKNISKKVPSEKPNAIS